MGDDRTGDLAARPGGIALHLVPEPVWIEQSPAGTYAPERFAEEGFVHTTYGEETLIEVANRFYAADPRPYLVLDLDLDRLPAEVEVRFDEAGPSFPHVYGPLQTAAVRRVRRLERAADGAFLRIGVDAGGAAAR